MQFRIIDLDGSILPQRKLRRMYRPVVYRSAKWGPRIRLACSWSRFQRFERALTSLVGQAMDRQPAVTLYGSGDFHHVSLGLLRRQPRAFNLLVIDNHPDWMRGLPILHCGTWLCHAASLPQVRRIFHVGGDVDFDNHYRWMAPWKLLETGKIIVFPARRAFRKGRWARVTNQLLQTSPSNAAEKIAVPEARLRELLSPFLRELAGAPLYISLDKDVMVKGQAVANWDSGHLSLAQTRTVLETFLTAAGGNLAGADIVGDWSPVQVDGIFRRFLNSIERPALNVDRSVATDINELTNLALLETIVDFAKERKEWPGLAAARQAAVP
jgi:arginase family enzyme